MSSEPLWKQLEPNWPIIGLVTCSFLLGKWGFSLFLLPILLYFSVGVERKWRENAVARELKEKLNEEDVRAVLLKGSTESVRWLNQTLRVAWPHLDRWLSATTTSFLIRTLVGINQPDETGKPKAVQFDVKYVSFGKTPLVIDGITSKTPSSPYTLRLDLDFTFRGDIVVELEAAFSIMKIPLVLNDLDMRGKLKLEMSFKDRGAIKMFSMSFLGAPVTNFSIRTMGKFDVMDLPTLKDTVNTVLVSYLKNSMTFPNAMKFDWSGPTSTPSDELSEKEAAELSRKFSHQTVSALDDEPEDPKSEKINSGFQRALSSSSAFPGVQAPPETHSHISDVPVEPTFKPQVTEPKLAASSSSVTLKTGAPTASPPVAVKRTSSSLQPGPKTTISSKKDEDLNEFLMMSPEQFSGVLQVRVVECQKLASSDIFSVSPYVVLEANGVTHKTIVVKRTSVPAWSNALFEFPVPRFLPAKGLVLKVHVYDKSKIGDDDSLGHVQLAMGRFIAKPDELADFWAPLVDTPSGKIRLQCKYIPE